MALQNTQFDAVMREYDRRQSYNRHLLEERTQEIYEKIPRIEEIQRTISAKGAAKARALLRGDEADIGSLREEIALLSEEKRELLIGGGYPADYLDPQYSCPICRDTGYVNGEKCACFSRIAVSLFYRQPELMEILKKENFQTFSFSCYSDKITDTSTGRTALWLARFAVRKATEFIDRFPEGSGNLFIYGDTGVGKSFLSHCIAYELLSRGVGVLYLPAYDLFEALADRSFGREDSESSPSFETLCGADLLIIDDLGAELTNNFVRSQLFALVNERLIRQKPMIISTNFDMETFSNTYTTRIFSRVMQSFTLLNLIGQDIRVQKTLGGNNHEAK